VKNKFLGWQWNIHLWSPLFIEEYAVATFYIHFRNGDHVALDDEGVDLPNIAAARDWAIKSARELVAEAIKFDSTIPNAVIVADESGNDLMTIAIKDVLPESLRG